LNFPKLASLLISALLISSVSSGFVVTAAPIQEASAQQGTPLHVAVSYTYNAQYSGRTIAETFSGSADLYPVEGGFEGNSTGSYSYSEDIVEPIPGCGPYEYHTTQSGQPDMVVHYQYSIDNSVTGGPDTSMYNSSYGVIEVLIDDRDEHWNWNSKNTPDCGDTDSDSGDNGSVGFGCFFYSMDFIDGGTYTYAPEITSQPVTSATCTVTINPHTEGLRIFGTSSVTVDGTKYPLSNSRVAVYKIVDDDDDDWIKPLSASKPDFFSATSTSDDNTAQYEFRFAREPGKLPRILVVSLLWYGGNPEFAVTNGKEVDGRFIPVYEAMCVDDIIGTDCEKWQRLSNSSYEAKVEFEYDNIDKFYQPENVMLMEDWEGGNATIQAITNSAYIYYNSYRAVKYFETLRLSTPFEPLMIKSHHLEGPDCPNAGAYYLTDAKNSGDFPKYADLGTYLDSVRATGSGIYFCDKDSASELPDRPVNDEWHEMGHYLLRDMYDFSDGKPYVNHAGYNNPSTNDSLVEGFAEFIGMLVNEWQGHPIPYIYPIYDGAKNLETDIKVWDFEEYAVAGILWDLHDSGTETNQGFVINGTRVNPSKVLTAFDDNVSLDAKTIIDTFNADEPKTLVDLYNSFSSIVPKSDLDMIFVNHGAFADIIQRNQIHDSWNETISQTGKTPDRLIRLKALQTLPGSFIVSDADAKYDVTFRHAQPFSYYDYSYIVSMKAGKLTYFEMPPEYYPSKAIFTPVSSDGQPLSPAFEIQSDEYWDFIHSAPPQDAVFKTISQTSSSENDGTALRYIQNVKDLLGKASQEYKAGNATGAQALVETAYLDNFEYVEPDLEQRNATDLKEDLETMLHTELIGLMRDGADQQTIDDEIALINLKLDEAIAIVPEFPIGISLLIVAFALTSALILGRFKRKDVGAASCHLAI